MNGLGFVQVQFAKQNLFFVTIITLICTFLIAEEMERKVGDLRPNHGKNGIQVSSFCV